MQVLISVGQSESIYARETVALFWVCSMSFPSCFSSVFFSFTNNYHLLGKKEQLQQGNISFEVIVISLLSNSLHISWMVSVIAFNCDFIMLL